MQVVISLGEIGWRGSLPALRGRLRPFGGERNPDFREALRKSVAQIEQATQAVAELPLASLGDLAAGNLPVPADGPAIERERRGDARD